MLWVKLVHCFQAFGLALSNPYYTKHSLGVRYCMQSVPNHTQVVQQAPIRFYTWSCCRIRKYVLFLFLRPCHELDSNQHFQIYYIQLFFPKEGQIMIELILGCYETYRPCVAEGTFRSELKDRKGALSSIKVWNSSMADLPLWQVRHSACGSNRVNRER